MEYVKIQLKLVYFSELNLNKISLEIQPLFYLQIFASDYSDGFMSNFLKLI